MPVYDLKSKKKKIIFMSHAFFSFLQLTSMEKQEEGGFSHSDISREQFCAF